MTKLDEAAEKFRQFIESHGGVGINVVPKPADRSESRTDAVTATFDVGPDSTLHSSSDVLQS